MASSRQHRRSPSQAVSPRPAPLNPAPSALLMPTVRIPVPQPRIRTRSPSPSPSPSPALADLFSLPQPGIHLALEWLGIPLNFVIATDVLEIPGYQMYAVEKWIVERDRPITVLTVYTGDPDHKITVTALTPSPSLSQQDAQVHWEKALHHLRRDGARPMQIPQGVLMATSLAHFRSDYTIVHIPHGNFLAAKDQLYTNINLLRMGCSGRSALTLEEPSDTTKDRFISTYHLPESTLTQSSLPAPTSTEYLPLHANHLSLPDASASSLYRQRSAGEDKTPHSSEAKLASPSKETGIGLGRPSIHIVGPSPTNSWMGAPEKPTQAPNPSPTSLSSVTGSKFKDKDTDKYGFLTIPQSKGRTKDHALFNATVLELVKLVQAGLTMFGMYTVKDPDLAAIQLDGLLCDVTVEGIRRWITEIGESCVGLEPMERIADPMFVSALLSLVLSVRNKISVLGFSHALPRDPFLHPIAFSLALTAYLHHGPNSPASPSNSPSVSPQQSLYTYSHPHFAVYSPFTSPPLQPPATLASPSPLSPSIPAILTRDLVEAIETAYDNKVRPGEGRKVRRVLKGKLEDLTSVVASGVVGVDGEGDETGRGHGRGAGLNSGEHTLASGLGLGGSVGGPGAVMQPTVDLAMLVRVIISKETGAGKTKRRTRERKQDSVDLGIIGYGRDKEKNRDAQVAASIRALWAGRVADLVRMREWEVERNREVLGGGADSAGRKSNGGGSERDRWRRERFLGVGSDGEVDERGAKSDGRSTEEESDVFGGNSFGGMWGEKVQKKLESWTGRTRRKGVSVDLSSLKAGSDGRPSLSRGSTGRAIGSRAQSPTLAPMVFAGDTEKEPDDDEPLSSGQVSPASDYRPNPFGLLQDGPSIGSSLTNLNSLTSAENEKGFNKLLNQKRPWMKRISETRVSSWSDPISARDDILDEEDGDSGDNESEIRRRRRAKRGAKEPSQLRSILTGEEDGRLVEEPLEMEDLDRAKRKQKFTIGPRRRRSFHDLDSLWGMRVLPAERMRIDVELCGQALIAFRREPHLRNVIACLKVLTNSLSETNTQLREDYQSHQELLRELEERAKILSDIDVENNKAREHLQTTNTLLYESEQFYVPDLWHMVSPSRAKVLSLREKVFGTGGRRLPTGVHGAHGRFNRLQWTIDGRERLVDYLGRTESEAEEETRVDPQSRFILPPEEDEDDVVEHPGIKPMWLLRLFMGWGSRGVPKAEESKPEKEVKAEDPVGNGEQSSKSDISAAAPNEIKDNNSTGSAS